MSIKTLPPPPFPLMANRPVQGGRLSPFRELYREGVRLFHIDATFSEDIFHPELRAWKEPGRFDYSAQEEYWKTLIAACPEARFCLRLYAASPPWWDDAHHQQGGGHGQCPGQNPVRKPHARR